MRFADQASQDRYYGRICGYPECCIEFYIACEKDGGHPPLRWLVGPPRKINHAGKLPRWVCGADKISRPTFVPCEYHWENPPAGFLRESVSAS